MSFEYVGCFKHEHRQLHQLPQLHCTSQRALSEDPEHVWTVLLWIWRYCVCLSVCVCVWFYVVCVHVFVYMKRGAEGDSYIYSKDLTSPLSITLLLLLRRASR